MVKRFGDSQDRCEPPRDPLVRFVQRRIRRMMCRGVRFAIVIAHQRCDDGPVAPLEPPNIAIEGEIFPVLVMPAMPHHVTRVMQQSPGFQQYSRLRGKMVRRLQLVEKENAQLAHMLGMLLIVSEPPGETS